jgi:hypothetical protein
MGRIYFYKLTADNGGAPCVENDLLSLAICKPDIRWSAKEGDLLFGFAAKELSADNRLIYIARVTEKLKDGAYYKDPQYAQRGDCIYRFKAGHYVWKSGSLHHCPNDFKDALTDDLGKPPEYKKASVLLSRDFRYFGKTGSAEYKSQYPLLAQGIEHLFQGHRVNHTPALEDELCRLADRIWQTTHKMKIGEPTSGPEGSNCSGDLSCARVQASSARSHKPKCN